MPDVNPPRQPSSFAERKERLLAVEAAEKAAKDALTPRGLGATPFVPGHGYPSRFPLDALPQRLREYVVDLAVRKQVPVDLPALFALGCIHAVAGPRFIIRRDLDWIQPLVNFIMVAIDSGGGKSPVVDELRAGLEKAQAVLAARHYERIETRAKEIEQQIQDLGDPEAGADGKAKTGKAVPEPNRGIIEQINDLKQQVKDLREDPPAPPQLLIDGDITVERLAGRLAMNNGAGAIVDDEPTFLRILGGMYAGKAGNLGVLLAGFDGRSYHPDRQRERSEPIKRAALSLVISPQPGILANTVADQILDASGFINRFAIAVPGDLAGQRKNRPSTYYKNSHGPRPEIALRRWWVDILVQIAEQPIIGADTGPYEVIDLDAAPTLDLTEAAWKRHVEYSEEFEERIHPSSADAPKLKAWGSKHAARVLRFAGALHLAAGLGVDTEVSEATMENAIAIGDWTIEHYLAISSVSGPSEGAGRIAEYIEASEHHAVTRTELAKKVFNHHVTKQQIDGYVAELVESGKYTLAKEETPGRPKQWLMKVGVMIPKPDEGAEEAPRAA